MAKTNPERRKAIVESNEARALEQKPGGSIVWFDESIRPKPRGETDIEGALFRARQVRGARFGVSK